MPNYSYDEYDKNHPNKAGAIIMKEHITANKPLQETALRKNISTLVQGYVAFGRRNILRRQATNVFRI